MSKRNGSSGLDDRYLEQHPGLHDAQGLVDLAPDSPRDRSINRGIIRAALLNSGYSQAQAETRIIEFERDVLESRPVEELRRLCEEYGLLLAIEPQP